MLRPVDCPYCGLVFEENAEYVNVGVGCIQVTGNACDRCGASEQGAYGDRGGPEVAFAWFPPCSYMVLGQREEWFDAMIARVWAEGVRYGYAHQTGAPTDSLAPVLSIPVGAEACPF